ncbi:hypothetical protein EV714DRAFT_203665 [Schizophyllum commune]
MNEPTPSMAEEGMVSASGPGAPEQNQSNTPRVAFEDPRPSAPQPRQRFANIVQRVMKRREEPQQSPRHRSAEDAAPGRSVAPDSSTAGVADPEVEGTPAPWADVAGATQTGHRDKADRTGGGQSDPPRYTSSDVDYEKKYAPDAYGEELSKDARVWSVYNDEAQIVDGEMVKGLNGTLDVLLVFAGLFSAVVTTFVVQSSQALGPDYAQITASLMYELVQIQRATASGTSRDVPMSSLTFDSGTTQTTDLWVNGLWLTSLMFALLTALVSVLAKQWIQYYSSLSGGSPRDRAHLRQYRFKGFERWKVRAIIGFLPVLLTVALLLFFAGLVVYVLPMDLTISLAIIGFSAAIILAYALMTIMPIFITHCAYKTPLADYMIIIGHAVKIYGFIAPLEQVRLLFNFVCESIRDKAIYRSELRRIVSNGRWIWHHRSSMLLKDRELYAVRRKGDLLMQNVLEWLIYSSLNASASRISMQASSALMPDGNFQGMVFYSQLLRDYLQTLDRDCTDLPTPEQVAVVERLARVAMHDSDSYLAYVRGVWSLGIWGRLDDYQAEISSPAARVVLSLALWIQFCNDQHRFTNFSVLRGALDACSLENISFTSPENPVIWRELDRMVRACLLLCDGWSPEGLGQILIADLAHEEVIATENHDQYRSPEHKDDLYENTAITLSDYCKGCDWADGPQEFTDNLERLQNALSERMARLRDGDVEDPTARVREVIGLALRLIRGIVLAQLRGRPLENDARYDARGDDGDDESVQLDIREVDISARATVHAPDEDTEGHDSTDAQRAPVAANGRGLLSARTGETTQGPAAVSTDAPDVEHDASQGSFDTAPDFFVSDAGDEDDERWGVGHFEPERHNAVPDTAAGPTQAANVAASEGLHVYLGSVAPAVAVGDAHIVRAGISEGVSAAGRATNDAPVQDHGDVREGEGGGSNGDESRWRSGGDSENALEK